MRTFIADIIPKLKNFSQQLDNLTLLTEQHWVVIDDIGISKTVYIFRKNTELLISQNGRVEKAKWEHLGHNSLLIDKKDESYLFKHGFFDENILVLKIDSKEEYVFLINETKYGGEFNSVENIIDYLNKKYIELRHHKKDFNEDQNVLKQSSQATYKIKQGELLLKGENISTSKRIIRAYLNGETAPDGRYKLGFMWYVDVKDGFLTDL